jgi:flagellar biosynthesis/type III secretory pathway protein FliH
VGVEKEKKVASLTETAEKFLELAEEAYDSGYDAGWADKTEAVDGAIAAGRRVGYANGWQDGFAAGNLAALGMQYRHLTN